MSGTLEVQTEQGPWGSRKVKVIQQVIQLFSNPLYKKHHNLRGFFGYFWVNL